MWLTQKITQPDEISRQHSNIPYLHFLLTFSPKAKTDKIIYVSSVYREGGARNKNTINTFWRSFKLSEGRLKAQAVRSPLQPVCSHILIADWWHTSGGIFIWNCHTSLGSRANEWFISLLCFIVLFSSWQDVIALFIISPPGAWRLPHHSHSSVICVFSFFSICLWK